MSFPAKRQHEETTAAKVGEGSAFPAPKPYYSVVRVGTEFPSESRPSKVARHNDPGEKGELFSNSAYASSKLGRDGGGSGPMEAAEGNNSKEGQMQQLKIKVREFGGGSGEGKSDRDPGRMDLERKASAGKDYADAVKESSGNKEVIGKVDVKGEDGGSWKVGQELADSNRGEGNSEGLRKRSPREDEIKVAAKDVVMDVKREEPREKEKEKKDEKRIERKEDVLPVLQQLPQPHLDVNSDKDNERDEREREREREREKGEKEKERVRERSRDREKEAVRSEKREKREKDRDRDSHRREREERDDSLAEKVEKEEGKGVKIEETDMDRKPLREVDDRKFVEKEGRERAKERDRDKGRDEEGEGEKRKKRGRDQEKDRDSLNAMDTEGAPGEKDKDAVHGYGVQQRKRMLRPRGGQSNPANRDSRSRFRPKDNEGTQGRPESSFINYRVGEGMPELAKLRKEYESGERNSPANGSGPTVEILICAELATTTNRQIRGSQLWGTDIYTDDSDIVAVLLHTGYYSPSATPPPNSISELRATIRILESQKMYTSTLRNGLRSRAWGGGSGCSYSVERCRIVKQGGGTVELEPCLNRTPQVSPTLAPAASERTVTTRAASSSAYRQQRFMQEVTIQYNLCNEPWAKYSMSIVADRGLKKSQFTSARLKNGEVLYVETHAHRYELAYDGERTTCNGATTATSFPQGTSGGDKAKEKWVSTERALVVSEKEPILHTHNGEKSHGNPPSNGQAAGHHGHTVTHHNSEPHECYRWSKCKRPLPLSSIKNKGVPLPAEFVEVLEEGLAWEEVQWSPTSVWVRGTEYALNRAQFFSFDKDDMEE